MRTLRGVLPLREDAPQDQQDGQAAFCHRLQREQHERGLVVFETRGMIEEIFPLSEKTGAIDGMDGDLGG